ncbi:MAG: DUF4287 domain-containing protein [Blastocatellia bacterium]|nr:DUF4287 domain-containing protein [Blastocatellia bacterium]
MSIKTTSSPSALYSVSPSVEMVRKWIADLPAKTGRSLEEWLTFIEENGPATEMERRAWLKQSHGIGTNAAWWLAERSVGKGREEDSPEAYLRQAAIWVDEMFSGSKAHLRPVADTLMQLAKSISMEVNICPGKTIIPFYRRHVFAQIKPATRTRIDLGLALGNTAVPERLIDTGGFAKRDRITHRIPLSSLKEIDDEVKEWLMRAYQRDAG